MSTARNRRILVIDDNPAIHADFRKTLAHEAQETASFADAEAALFDDAPDAGAGGAAGTGAEDPAADVYELDFASQGEEGLAKVRAARERGTPYALAFVDVRMPPGIDGVETIARMWQVDPEVQAVICTAFADYSWPEMVAKLGRTDRLLILKKPFDPTEVRQLASALTEKWNAARREGASLAAARKAELEARAYAASLETMNRALETSRHAAEAMSGAKTELLLKLAHNVFGPMDAFLCCAEQMGAASGAGEAELLERLGELCRDGTSLRRSLQDVLDLSELEAGALRLSTATFAPRELARAVVAELAPEAAERALALELEIAPEVPASMCSDAQRVRQILLHLLDNAIEHTPAHGFVRLALGARRDDRSGECRVSFEVVDSGSGLTRDQEGLIFEPFCNGPQDRRADGARRGHLGLGLCVSKRLAQKLGGDVTVERPSGAGCRFVLTLGAGVPAAG